MRIKKWESFNESLTNENKTGVSAAIAKVKKSLIAKAKKSGLTENFGQKEIQKLEDKFGDSKELSDFSDWCMNLDLSDLK